VTGFLAFPADGGTSRVAVANEFALSAGGFSPCKDENAFDFSKCVSAKNAVKILGDLGLVFLVVDFDSENAICDVSQIWLSVLLGFGVDHVAANSGKHLLDRGSVKAFGKAMTANDLCLFYVHQVECGFSFFLLLLLLEELSKWLECSCLVTDLESSAPQLFEVGGGEDFDDPEFCVHVAADKVDVQLVDAFWNGVEDFEAGQVFSGVDKTKSGVKVGFLSE
jgi:hypothetical protein